VAVRAATLSFTHDESFTYTRHVHDPLSSIVLYDEVTANNHLLNTLAMKLAEGTLGTSELALRASSVVAFAVYVVSIAVLLLRVDRWPVRVLGFSLAIANPYVLDFFSLARGYALALALVAASAVAIVRYVERPSGWAALAASACAGVAVLSSFATLVYFVAVLLVTGLALVVPRPARADAGARRRIAAAVTLPVVVVAILGVVPLIRLRSASELYVGGVDGFWQDTVYSIAWSALYRQGWEPLAVVVVVLVAISVVAGAVPTFISIRERDLPLHATAFILVAAPAVVSVLQHHVLESRFLIERTALFFVPLYAIWLAYAADALARRWKHSAGVTITAVVIAGAAWVNLVAAANFSYVLDWRYDSSTERMLDDLDGLREGRRVDFGASWLFEPTINFYRQTKRLSWLPPLPMDCRGVCVTDESDYYYVIGSDVGVVRDRGALAIREYRLSESILMRERASSG
jgi:hypothetical protein